MSWQYFNMLLIVTEKILNFLSSAFLIIACLYYLYCAAGFGCDRCLNTNKPLNFESVKSQVCSCWGPLDCMRHLMTQDMSLAVISLISPMKPIVHYQWL